MPTTSTLVTSDGRPIEAKHIARIRARASLEGGYPNPFPYEAANVGGQEMGGWFPQIKSPDSEINLYRDRVVSRARDLVRNDGWANGAVDRILDNAVGAQFRLVAKPSYMALQRECKAMDASWAQEFGRAVEAEWQTYADDPNRYSDASRTQTVTQIFRMLLSHKLVDGDSLAVLQWLPEFVGPHGARYATAIQVIDPDRLSNPYQMVDTADRRGGVQIDRLGAPLGYHIRRAEQNDWYLAAESMIWDYVPRWTDWGRPIVVDDFDRTRAGQHRGISILAPILSGFKMLTRYDAAELQAAILQTIMSFFIESPYDEQDVANTLDSDGDNLRTYGGLRSAFHQAHPVTAGGVRIPKLFPGEKIGTVAPTRPGSNFEAFEHGVLRRFAASTGNSAEQVSSDYSRTNYSSARAAMLEAWKTLIRRRSDFATGTATPIYAAWLEEALDPVSGRLRGLLPKNAPAYTEWRAAYARNRWIGPGRGWVDPVKERQGEVLGLDAGFGTLEQSCAEQGMDWEENLHQRAREVQLMDELGLPKPDWAVGGIPANETETRPQPA